MEVERVVSTCPIHGEHENLVCVKCYNVQAVHVERVSNELRYENTSDKLRARALALQAERNGHGY